MVKLSKQCAACVCSVVVFKPILFRAHQCSKSSMAVFIVPDEGSHRAAETSLNFA